MLVELLFLNSPIEADSDGLSMISTVCDALKESIVTVDELWPGEIYSLST